ncbi:Fis family transcriptional regulator [Rhodovastum atsumiense]|uniref:Fis family transcriptional regulator n=1 Tax=Rhodovastum atsumiense TaxID=504468 RepID=A0A5M6IT59_9PROT|nr:DUF364 domain-containing protein [Rhodovastum atsumiense]KAA5610625.1 Fis family transcriptional regulator [Rhodovastum atsumiense]CAH2600746.1 Fis family transcriptional regulator [Rhodovastum atsumiense]
MPQDGILADIIADVAATLGTGLADIAVTRAVVGLYFTGVALDTGSAGVCVTPAKTAIHATCCPTADDTVVAPGTLRGRRAVDLLDEIASPHPLRRALAIATLNALAETCWQRRPHPDVLLRPDMDAFDAAAIAPGEHVVLVGAFVPFLRALKRMRQDYTVLELSADMLKPEELPHFRPAAAAAEVIPHGDVVLLTGSTLLNDTLEDLLLLARPEARVVVVGPTVGLMPEAFLRRGVDILGGVRITAPETFLDVLAEGGSGHHFFGRSASRMVMLRQSPKQATARAA